MNETTAAITWTCWNNSERRKMMQSMPAVYPIIRNNANPNLTVYKDFD